MLVKLAFVAVVLLVTWIGTATIWWTSSAGSTHYVHTRGLLVGEVGGRGAALLRRGGRNMQPPFVRVVQANPDQAVIGLKIWSGGKKHCFALLRSRS